MDLQEVKASFITFFSFLASVPDHKKNCFNWQKQMHVKDCCCLVEPSGMTMTKIFWLPTLLLLCCCLVIHRHPSCSKSFKAKLFPVTEQRPMPSQSQATNPSICVLQAPKIFLNYARRLGTQSVFSHKHMV